MNETKTPRKIVTMNQWFLNIEAVLIPFPDTKIETTLLIGPFSNTKTLEQWVEDLKEILNNGTFLQELMKIELPEESDNLLFNSISIKNHHVLDISRQLVKRARAEDEFMLLEPKDPKTFAEEMHLRIMERVVSFYNLMINIGY